MKCTRNMVRSDTLSHIFQYKLIFGNAGPFVRIAPNHVSIAEPDALGMIYGHGNGALKSDFYDAFASIGHGVFTTRDRNDHTRKRKMISHIFSQKSVSEFEPQIRLYVGQCIEQWDRLCEKAVKGFSGEDGEGGGTRMVDCGSIVCLVSCIL